MKGPNIRELLEAFPGKISREEAKKLSKAFEDAMTHDDIDKALRLAKEIIGGYGIEELDVEDYRVDRHYYNTIALYVNMGMAEELTILFDTENWIFYITSWGEFKDIWDEEHHEEDGEEYEPVVNEQAIKEWILDLIAETKRNIAMFSPEEVEDEGGGYSIGVYTIANGDRDELDYAETIANFLESFVKETPKLTGISVYVDVMDDIDKMAEAIADAVNSDPRVKKLPWTYSFGRGPEGDYFMNAVAELDDKNKLWPKSRSKRVASGKTAEKVFRAEKKGASRKTSGGKSTKGSKSTGKAAPPKGKTKVVTYKTKNGTRTVTMMATGKKGFGEWKIIKSTWAPNSPRKKSSPSSSVTNIRKLVGKKLPLDLEIAGLYPVIDNTSSQIIVDFIDADYWSPITQKDYRRAFLGFNEGLQAYFF